MTRGELMRTSEITDRLHHRNPAVTRAWISALPAAVRLTATDRDIVNGEKMYARAEVEAAIAATTQRGPYRIGSRQSRDEPPDEQHGAPELG